MQFLLVYQQITTKFTAFTDVYEKCSLNEINRLPPKIGATIL